MNKLVHSFSRGRYEKDSSKFFFDEMMNSISGGFIITRNDSIAYQNDVSSIILNKYSNEKIDSFFEYCTKDLKLPIIGLMCIPPQNEDPAMHFAFLKKIADRNSLFKLSMGMSNDFKEAIKFGATSVRIGSLFFGPREF